MKFIDYLAERIIEQNIPFENLTVILPSIRAKKYLEKALIKRISGPTFSPELITIDRWIIDNSGLNIGEPTELLFELYNVHKELVEADEDGSFDAFVSWGKTLLSDFDEIERYLVEPDRLFKNLRDIKEIEHWELGDEGEMSPAQKKFLAFWEKLNLYYHRFQIQLKKSNLATPGMAFRKVTGNLDLVIQNRKDHKFIFSGFNALSLAEMTIMKKLKDRGMAEVIQDNDAFYVNNRHHEGGFFQRKLKKFLEVNKLDRTTDRLAKESKELTIIECNQPSAQVHVASSLLTEKNVKNLDETLLLLGDETLVGPMIKNLPLNIGKANITMGIELSNTSLKLWVDLLFNIQDNFLRFNTKALYFKDLFKLWHHPFYQALVDEKTLKLQQKKEQDILRKNKLFIPFGFHEHESEKLQEILKVVYDSWGNNWSKGLENISKLNQLVYAELSEKWTMEKAGLHAFHSSMSRLKKIMSKGYPNMGLKTFQGIFQQHYGASKIAFEGNPTDGLQIMGLLETRLLDFKSIIVLGMNEGKLPNDNPIQSLIPMDLRSGFGLPTNREKQGLFAHHFYRLLHEAEDLTLVYSQGKTHIGTDEPSRYIQQLEMEWCRVNTNIKLTRKQFSLEANASVNDGFEIEKKDEMLEIVDAIFTKGMSASALNKYLSCPMDFYYRYIMGLGEEDIVEEEMNASSFGSIVHNVLEELFLPFSEVDKKGEKNPNAKSLTLVDLANMEAKAERFLHKGFMEHYDNDEKAFLQGRNYLSYQMSIELTKNFFNEHKAWLGKQTEPVGVMSLERPYKAEIELNIFDQKKSFNILGLIDRIDRIGDKTRVIDYKSGKVDEKKMKLAGRKNEDALARLIATIKNGNKSHVLQLLFYAYLIKNNFGYLPDQLSIISFINYPEGGLNFDPGNDNIGGFVDLLPEALGIVLEELYDKEIPFKHNPQNDYCTYCA